MSKQNNQLGMKQLSAKAMLHGIIEIQIPICLSMLIHNRISVRIHDVTVVLMYFCTVVLERFCLAAWKHGKPDVLTHFKTSINRQRKNETYLYILNYSL